MTQATTLKRLAVLLLAFGGAVQVQAQITITEADVQSFFATTTEVEILQVGEDEDVPLSDTDAAVLQAIVNATGPGQTYDFTAVSFMQDFEGTYEYISLPTSDIPGSDDDDFSDATFVLKVELGVEETGEDSTAWVYQSLQDDGLYSVGAIFETDVDLDEDGTTPDQVKITYDPLYLNVRLPLTSTSTWTSQTTQTFGLGGEDLFSATLEDAAVVDGYGTLVTSAGSFDCLRYTETSEITFSLGGIESTETSQSVTFVTKTGTSASIELDEDGSVVSASITNAAGTGTPVEQVSTDVPEAYRLGQNYPNPFNPSTTIGYELKEAQRVRLGVYDVLGREVAVLVNAHQAAGGYDVTFEAADLPSGLYLYRLEAGGEVLTRTMTLMK